MDALPVAATTLLALIFLRAAWHKATARLETAGIVRAYGLVPDAWAGPLVPLLAAAEAAVVAALALPAARPLGALGAAALLLGYAGAMALAMRAGRTAIDCGCGGAPQPLSGALLVRNASLAAVALGLAAAPAGSVAPGAAAAGVAGGLTLWFFLGAFEAVHSNVRHLRRPA